MLLTTKTIKTIQFMNAIIKLLTRLLISTINVMDKKLYRIKFNGMYYF